MSLRGENPITSYFSRLSPSSKLKTPKQSKLILAKRARQPDEGDTTWESARKKTKGRRQKVIEDQEPLSSPSVSLRSNPVQTSRSRRTSKVLVIEIQDTPPSSPIKRRVLRHPTPPSSPLPDLTPSPSPPPRSRSPSYLTRADDLAEAGPSCHASIGVSYLTHGEHALDFLPSSQTQELYSERYEEPRTAWLSGLPSSTIPFQSSESESPQTLDYVPSSQFDTIPSGSDATPDELIASSQSQLLGAVPTSSIDTDFDFVMSSQSQEFTYSQRHWDMSEQRASILDACITEFPALNRRLSANEVQDNQTRTETEKDDDELPLSATTLDSQIQPPESCKEDDECRHTIAIPSSQTQPDVDEGEPPPPQILSSQTQPESVVGEDGLYSRPVSPNSQIPACSSQAPVPDDDREHISPTQPSQDHRFAGTGSHESLPEVVKEFQSMFGETFESLPPDFPMSLRF